VEEKRKGCSLGDASRQSSCRRDRGISRRNVFFTGLSAQLQPPQSFHAKTEVRHSRPLSCKRPVAFTQIFAVVDKFSRWRKDFRTNLKHMSKPKRCRCKTGIGRLQREDPNGRHRQASNVSSTDISLDADRRELTAAQFEQLQCTVAETPASGDRDVGRCLGLLPVYFG